MFSPLDSLISSYKLNKNHPDHSIRLIEEIGEELVRLLPHGSGIDCAWSIEHRKDLQFYCHNYWHSMDQNGFYCGYVSFNVKIDLSTMEFDIDVSQNDIDDITKQYDIDEEFSTDEEIENCNENNPCPYLDDLDDMLYEDIRFSMEAYFVEYAVKYAVNSYPDIIKRVLAKV